MRARSFMPKMAPVPVVLRPPPGARLTGEMLPDGRPVYLVTRERKTGEEPMVDHAGRPVEIRLPDGTKRRRMTAVTVREEVEVVLVDGRNGQVWISETFRQAPEEIEADRRRELARLGQEQIGELGVALAEEGLTITDLIKSLRGEPSDGKPDNMAKAREALAAKRAAAKNGS